MSLPKVSITVNSSGLGRVADTDDYVCGLVLSGIAATSLAQNVGARITSLASAVALGITLATHPHAYSQISTFFSVGGSNQKLWIMLVPDTTTAAAIAADNGPLDKLLATALGEITLAGWSMKRAGGYSPGSAYFDYVIETVGAQCQVVANRYASGFSPVRIVMEGSYLSASKLSTGDAFPTLANVGDRVAAFCGAEASGDRHACMGRLFGWMAAGQVHENPGKVKRGAFLGTGYLTTGVAISAYTAAQIATIHDAGIMALRSYLGVGGAYVTDSVSFAATTSDFRDFTLGLVMDKAIRLTYITYVNEILDTIEVTKEGKMSPNKVSYLEDIINNALKLSMTAKGNVSSAASLIDAAQNILSTGRVEIGVSIIPLGTIKEIAVTLQFTNPALAA